MIKETKEQIICLKGRVVNRSDFWTTVRLIESGTIVELFNKDIVGKEEQKEFQRKRKDR